MLTDKAHPVHKRYHDKEYGFAVTDESVLFERLILEINQAGLSWESILKKRDGFQAAYDGFQVDKVAGYGEVDVARLLADAGIIRNRLKVAAAIHNAEQVTALRQEFGSFAGWLEAHHPRPLPEWVKLFRSAFKFTGGEIVNEFLMSTGYLPGAHAETCPIYKQVIASGAPWAR